MGELVNAGRSLEELAREFEPTAQSIKNWVAQAARNTGHGDDGLTTTEREELSRLRRENRQLKLEREILSKAAAWFARETNRCYGADTLTPVIGAWNDPYFETLIGVGFSGSCFEALTVVAHLTQSLSALVAPNGDRPMPCKDGLVHLIAKITEAYFNNHSLDGDPILRMLVFGFDEQRPWIGRVSWDTKAKIEWNVDWAAVDTLKTIGQDALFEQRAADWKQRIQKHRVGVGAAKNGAANEDAAFKRELCLAHHDIADKKITEEEMLRQIGSDIATGIGGVLQRLELGLDGGHVVAGFTQDDRPCLDGASYTVSQGAHLAVCRIGVPNLTANC